MTELWLKFTDEAGDAKSVLVEHDRFVIGRHSGNNLSISDERLSREHIKIERFGDIYIVSDCNSSNGTTLNGARLTEPVALNNKDVLNLGGNFEIQVEVISDYDSAVYSSANENHPDTAENNAGATVSSSPAADGSSIPMSFFWLAPVFGLLVMMLVGGLFLAFSGKPEKEVSQNDDGFTFPKTPKDNSKDGTPAPKQQSSPKTINENTSGAPTPETISSQTLPKVSGEIETVGQNSSLFLRAIALNDPKAYLEDKQIEMVNSKISQFKGSTALAENLKNVKKNAAEFATLANSKNLKPQFLAVAALAKMGNAPGNTLEMAKTMLPVLGELKVTLANNLADDNLLIIAAYDKGAAGKPRALQGVIEALSKKSDNASAREIRTIWFLKDNGKLTDAEFDFALRFLAIGTISQNPSKFNVNAEGITF